MKTETDIWAEIHSRHLWHGVEAGPLQVARKCRTCGRLEVRDATQVNGKLTWSNWRSVGGGWKPGYPDTLQLVAVCRSVFPTKV